MSADLRHAETLIKIAVAWGLFGCGGIALADEEPAPDLEFLEYLGSWEESDEEWVLLAAETIDPEDTDNKDKGSAPAPDGEKMAETDDEN